MGWLAEAIGTGSYVSDVKWGECQLGQMTMKQATVTTGVLKLREWEFWTRTANFFSQLS